MLSKMKQVFFYFSVLYKLSVIYIPKLSLKIHARILASESCTIVNILH